MSRICFTLSRIPPFLLSALLILAILLLTLLPGNELPTPPDIPLFDKWTHALMFGTLAVVLLYDWSRRRGSLTWHLWVAAATISTLLGGAIELLQDAMGLGRSGEWLDFVADAIGAFILPIPLWPLLRRILQAYSLSLLPLRPSSRSLPWVESLYTDAFPAHERRPWDALLEKFSDCSNSFHITGIYSMGRIVGFISWWQMDNFRYVEHFAIHPFNRSAGIGAKAITRFIGHGSPVVLEVEPADTGTMASRRIDFYSRCGFKPHPRFPYIQPPYAPGLPAIPLMLMTASAPGTATPVDLPQAAATIHTRVYGRPGPSGTAE